MQKTIDEIINILQTQEAKLRYIAEKEDKPGLSPILTDIALRLFGVADSLKEGIEDGKTD